MDDYKLWEKFIYWFICGLLVFAFVLGCGFDVSAKDFKVLNNGIIEVRLSKSGSIFYVSEIGGRNLINNRDMGRQIQPSFYAGHNYYDPNAHEAWDFWPWNIIQSGDVFGNEPSSLILDKGHDSCLVTSVPMFWNRNNIFEYGAVLSNDISLIESKVKVIVRLKLFSSCGITNSTQRHQEMPAVYTANNLDRLISDGVVIESKENKWVYWAGSEWVGAFDDTGHGIAVYNPDAELFIGGRYECGNDKTTP